VFPTTDPTTLSAFPNRRPVVRHSVLVLFILANGLLRAQGGGDLNPDLRAHPAAVARFQDLRVGLSVRWGPSSQSGQEISWSRGRHRQVQKQLVPVAEYDQLYKTFNPVKFDANEWARLAKRWGMRYILPTAKHHDGFALWFSRWSQYDMENTPFRRDIMAELGQACRQHDLVFGTYYSNLDWYHPDWSPYEPEPGPLFPRHSDSPNLQRYLDYMLRQLTELIGERGVQIVQFDGEWPKTWTHEVGSKMYRDLRALSSDVILSSRIDRGRVDNKGQSGWNRKIYAGDYEERERLVEWLAEDAKREDSSWSEDPWQAWVTVDRRQWSWNPEPDLLKPSELIVDLVRTVGANGNLAINIAPQPDGSFHPDQVALLDEVGKWLAAHAGSIYGTRGGPFYPAEWGVSTRKGKLAFLHILKWDGESLKIPPVKTKIVSASLFGTKTAVKVKQTSAGVELQVPPNRRAAIDTIVTLEFNSQPEMAAKH
jgi:alpha-L-fucosidase